MEYIKSCLAPLTTLVLLFSLMIPYAVVRGESVVGLLLLKEF
jgi:hypothetical protein